MEFDPPVSVRKNKELFNVISNDLTWAKELQLLAKEELYRRNFSPEAIEKEKTRRINTIKKFNERRSKKLEKNKTESYTVTEMVLLLAFFPLSIIIHSNPFSEFWKLDAGNYKKKIWQRIILILASILLWLQIIRLLV